MLFRSAAIGDSSPCDDGSGDSGDILYDGYIADASGNHQKLLMNATIWLATKTTPITAIDEIKKESFDFRIYPNPTTNGNLNISFSGTDNSTVTAQLIDLTGKVLRIVSFDNNSTETQHQLLNVKGIQSGMYLCKISNSNISKTQRVVISE